MHGAHGSLLVGSSCACNPAGLWDWKTSGKTNRVILCLGTGCPGMQRMKLSVK